MTRMITAISLTEPQSQGPRHLKMALVRVFPVKGGRLFIGQPVSAGDAIEKKHTHTHTRGLCFFAAPAWESGAFCRPPALAGRRARRRKAGLGAALCPVRGQTIPLDVT